MINSQISIGEYQEFLDFQNFKRQKQLQSQSDAYSQPGDVSTAAAGRNVSFDGADIARDKENQPPNSKTILSQKGPESDDFGPSKDRKVFKEDDTYAAAMNNVQYIQAQLMQGKSHSQIQPKSTGPRPAGESSSDGGPMIEELKMENQS